MTQHGGTVGDGAFAGQVFGRALEQLECFADTARAVGIAEMRHERDLVDLRQRVETGPGGAETFGRKPQPVHATVHLEEDALRHVGLVRGQHVDLRIAMHRMPEVETRTEFEVACLEHAFEQQDRPPPAQRPHALGFVQIEQRETVGTAETVEHALDAVTVGVGLDDGPHARVERRAPDALQVVAQRAGMDGGEDGAWH